MLTAAKITKEMPQEKQASTQQAESPTTENLVGVKGFHLSSKSLWRLVAIDVTKATGSKTIYKSNPLDLWALGITIVIGGQYFSWNPSYQAGYLSCLLSAILMGIGYITLCLCISEISSALPFAGGAYGLTRCTLGYTAGFVVGCCQILEYIAYTSSAVVFTADIFMTVINGKDEYKWLIWAFIYLSSLYVHIAGGKLFWRSNLILAFVSIAIVLLYLLCSYITADYTKFFKTTDVNYGFSKGLYGFIQYFPISAWLYVGVEALNFASDDVILPKQTIPKSQLRCVLTLFFTGLLIVLVCPTNFKSILDTAVSLTPFDAEFHESFGISLRLCGIVTLPAAYATSFGFIYSFGRLIQSMSTSKLFPFVLSTVNAQGCPFLALLAGSLLGFLGCFLMFYIPAVNNQMFNICFLNACISYIVQAIGYIILRIKFSNLVPSFRSPLGIFGACISFSVFFLAAISTIFFQPDYITLITGICQWALVLGYYYGYAKKRQTFSPEENKIMLVAHIMNFNARKKQVKTSSDTAKKGSKNGSQRTPGKQSSKTSKTKFSTRTGVSGHV